MQTWAEFLRNAEKEDFKIGYKNTFKIADLMDEEEIVMYNKEKGLILYAESSKKLVNTAIVYGVLKLIGETTFIEDLALLNCSLEKVNEGAMPFSFDVRENFNKLKVISGIFELLPIWPNKRIIFFVNDTEIRKNNYEKITFDKVNLCSGEIRNIIGV